MLLDRTPTDTPGMKLNSEDCSERIPDRLRRRFHFSNRLRIAIRKLRISERKTQSLEIPLEMRRRFHFSNRLRISIRKTENF